MKQRATIKFAGGGGHQEKDRWIWRSQSRFLDILDFWTSDLVIWRIVRLFAERKTTKRKKGKKKDWWEHMDKFGFVLHLKYVSNLQIHSCNVLNITRWWLLRIHTFKFLVYKDWLTLFFFARLFFPSQCVWFLQRHLTHSIPKATSYISLLPHCIISTVLVM